MAGRGQSRPGVGHPVPRIRPGRRRLRMALASNACGTAKNPASKGPASCDTGTANPVHVRVRDHRRMLRVVRNLAIAMNRRRDLAAALPPHCSRANQPDQRAASSRPACKRIRVPMPTPASRSRTSRRRLKRGTLPEDGDFFVTCCNLLSSAFATEGNGVRCRKKSSPFLKALAK